MADRLTNTELVEKTAAENGRSPGRLTIFLGYAAGVGKTHAMLAAARQRQREGIDIVAGCVDTHGQAALEEMVAAFTAVPRLDIVYGGLTTAEMDTDAIVQRAPQLVLVDNLAHANAPGSRHAHRYQDVQELLAAGLDVYTTLNIQHLESLNDVVAKITGVTVHETVPDYVLDDAHEMELVDMPVEELLARLRAGKVHVPEQARRTIAEFFRPGNLLALREMALRRAAERIDEQMRAYMQDHDIVGPWPAGERVLVCVSPSPLSQRLVRSARRLARRLNAAWIAAYVETPEHTDLLPEDRDRVTRTLHLAESLGAQTVRLSGRSVADTVVDYAQSQNVTKIVAGKPLHSRWRELLRGGSLIDQIVRQSRDVDVYVISGAARSTPTPVSRTVSSPGVGGRAYLLSAGLVLLATLIGLPLRPFITPTNLTTPYLLAVVLAAVRLGRFPAMLASLLSVIAFATLFVPPYYTFAFDDAEYGLTFLGLLVVGLVISTLTARAREQEMAARRREMQTAALYGLSQKLVSITDVSDIAQTVVNHVYETLANEVALFLPTGEEASLVLETSTPHFQLEDDTLPVAGWVFRHGQPAGRYTDTLQHVQAYCLPLQTSGHVVGVMAVQFNDDALILTLEQRRLLESIAGQVALALARAALAEEAHQAQLMAETEKLQTALLNSISHDLRTPLASITGVLSSLHDDAALLTAEAQRDLVHTAWEEARRLNRLVGNLLDMTRLESGALKVVRQPSDVQDLVGSALAQLPNRLQDRAVQIDVPDDLPLIDVDFTLMVQVLVNLIDNAVKYAPPPAPIEINARREADSVILAVKDRGPGLQEGELALVFRRFFRGSAPGAGGTGLGLSIVKGIVEAHNGRVWAENRPGSGAAFFVALSLPKNDTQ